MRRKYRSRGSLGKSDPSVDKLLFISSSIFTSFSQSSVSTFAKVNEPLLAPLALLSPVNHLRRQMYAGHVAVREKAMPPGKPPAGEQMLIGSIHAAEIVSHFLPNTLNQPLPALPLSHCTTVLQIPRFALTFPHEFHFSSEPKSDHEFVCRDVTRPLQQKSNIA